ncbi:glycosyltransferase [Priestia aryabhattai]|uniref:glycosyltransferase n=1 Tax=Priestia aryabhattai TaxID=412384 RepID=UPI00210C548B|nr:glycosyltransferase [Priestia aryabhattai]
MRLAMIRLYCGDSGQKGFYNMQELGLAKAFIKMGINVYIIMLSNKVKTTVEEKDSSGAILLTVPARNIINHGFFNCSILTELKIDVVHLQSDNQIYAPHVMRFCYKQGIECYNYVGTLYSDSNKILKASLMRMFTKRNIKYFKEGIVFAKTPTVHKQLKKAGAINAQIAPVGLDTEVIPTIQQSKFELRKKLGIPQNKKVLIFVGRLERYKNPISALKLIQDLKQDCHLIFVGKGTLQKEFLQKVSELKLQSTVKYIESVPNKEIHSYYKASDFFINLNDKEIFGMSILEAMYQGCTVVAFKAPGPNYIIEDGVSGYLVNNIKEMEEKVKNENFLEEESKKRIQSNFRWELTAKTIISTLNFKKEKEKKCTF